VLSGGRLRPNDIMRTRLVMEYAGGKGNNAARALAHMGVAVTATGFQGGQSGQLCIRQLASEGMATRFVHCDCATRISTMLHEEETGCTYGIYEPGQQVTAAELQELYVLFEQLIASHEIVLLCGSGQTDALARAFFEMTCTATAQGVPVLLDSSGEALRLGISARPYLVKVNQHELEAFWGTPLDTAADRLDALRALCRQGIQISALTLGREGLIVTDGVEAWWGLLEIEAVINTVGCGDSALAGMAYAIGRQAGLVDVARWGLACGAANTLQFGAGFIDRETVRQLFPLIQLTRLTSRAEKEALARR